MLTQAQFNEFWKDFAGKFPAAGEYAKKQELPAVFLDGVYQSLSAFELETLQQLITLTLKGEIDPVPNTQLGHLGSELRIRARQVNELRRQKQPQKWQETESRWSPTRELAKANMTWMLKCAMAVDKLLGREGPEYAKDAYAYQQSHSVSADNSPTRPWDKCTQANNYARHTDGYLEPIAGYHDGNKVAKDAYDAAIIMADDHSAYEEDQCLQAFARANLTWEQIQQTARGVTPGEIVKLAQEGIIT